MRPTRTVQEPESYYVVAVSIFFQLATTIEATARIAFYNNPKRNSYVNQIFVLYLAFSLVLIFLTLWQLCTRLHFTKTKSSTLNWLWVICTVVTIGVFNLLNNNVHLSNLNLESYKRPPVIEEESVIFWILILFPTFYAVTTVSSIEQIPFLVFVILLQMGAGLAVTVPTAFDFDSKDVTSSGLLIARLIFSTELELVLILFCCIGRELCCQKRRNTSASYSLSQVTTKTLFWTGMFLSVFTGLVFAAIFSGSSTNETNTVMFKVYLYSCYFLILLGCMRKPSDDVLTDVDTGCLNEPNMYQLNLI